MYFAAPAYGRKRMEMASIERAWVFVPAGVVLLVLASVLGFHLWRTA